MSTTLEQITHLFYNHYLHAMKLGMALKPCRGEAQSNKERFKDFFSTFDKMNVTSETTFCDVGCGKGNILLQLGLAGYKSYGLDKVDGFSEYIAAISTGFSNLSADNSFDFIPPQTICDNIFRPSIWDIPFADGHILKENDVFYNYCNSLDLVLLMMTKAFSGPGTAKEGSYIFTPLNRLVGYNPYVKTESDKENEKRVSCLLDDIGYKEIPILAIKGRLFQKTENKIPSIQTLKKYAGLLHDYFHRPFEIEKPVVLYKSELYSVADKIPTKNMSFSV